MKANKLGVLTAVLAMTGALALGGCDAAGSEGSGSASASSQSGSGYELVEEGILTIGTSAEYEPFEYMENGEYKGFDLDLAAAIADDLGLDLKIENVDFDTIVPGVASGTKYDAGFGAITVTPQREESVDFSESYYMDDQAIVTMKGNDQVTSENCEESLNSEGVKIAVQSGSTAEAFAKENFPKAQLVPFKNATDCFAALQSDQAVALVTNRSVAAQLTAGSFDNEQVIKLVPTGEEYAIAVGKENAGLKDAINASLEKLAEDGTIDGLMEKYSIK